MAVMMPRQKWSDDHLDQFEKRIEERFDRIEADIKELRGDIKQMQRTMLHGFIAICTVMVGGFAALAGVAG